MGNKPNKVYVPMQCVSDFERGTNHTCSKCHEHFSFAPCPYIDIQGLISTNPTHFMYKDCMCTNCYNKIKNIPMYSNRLFCISIESMFKSNIICNYFTIADLHKKTLMNNNTYSFNDSTYFLCSWMIRSLCNIYGNPIYNLHTLNDKINQHNHVLFLFADCLHRTYWIGDFRFNDKKDYFLKTILTGLENSIYKIVQEKHNNLNIQLENGMTVLMYCAVLNDLKLCNFFVDNGAKVHFKSNENYSVIDYLLLSDNTIINNDMIIFCNKIMSDVIFKYDKILLKISMDCKFFTEDLQKFIIELINRGTNINDFEITPIVFACKNNNIELVNLLIQFGANVNRSDDLNISPIIYACKNNNIELTKLLIKSGADVNHSDNTNSTALIYASQFDNIELVKLLINAGAKIEVSNNKRINPITMAFSEKRFDIYEYLVNIYKNGKFDNMIVIPVDFVF